MASPAILLWGIAGAAFFVAVGPLLVEQGRQIWAKEHYRFVVLLLPAAAYLGFRRFRSVPVQEYFEANRRPVVRFGLWGAVLFLTATAVAANSPFMATIALLASLPAVFYEFGGGLLAGKLFAVCAVLCLAVPLPFGWDGRLVVSLQKIATDWASTALDLLEMRHLTDGVALRLPGREFFVDEACSGVHSLFATLAFVAVFCAAVGHGFLRSTVLLVSAVAWVIVGNAIRVVSIVVLATRYDLPVTEGLGHELIGFAAFAAVVALVLSTDQFLLALWPRRPEYFRRLFAASRPAHQRVERSEPVDPIPQPASVRPRRLTAVSVAIGFVALAVTSFLLPTAAMPKGQSPIASAVGLKPVAEDALPAAWEGWTRIKFETRERSAGDLAGQFSRIWYYRKGRITAAISIDGPFFAWHDTSLCYEALDYTVDSTRDIETPEEESSPARFTELRIRDEFGRRGFVLFMAYSESDAPLSPPRASRRDPLTSRIIGALQGRVGSGRGTTNGERVYQVQLFAQNRLDFTEGERADLERLFHESRRVIAGAADQGTGVR